MTKPYPFDASLGFTSYKPAVSSTNFIVNGTLVSIKDDGLGNLMLVTAGSDVQTVVRPIAGTVDYTTGAVKLSNLNVSSFDGSAINFTANSTNKDIRPPKDRILVIRGADVTVSVSTVEG